MKLAKSRSSSKKALIKQPDKQRIAHLWTIEMVRAHDMVLLESSFFWGGTNQSKRAAHRADALILFQSRIEVLRSQPM